MLCFKANLFDPFRVNDFVQHDASEFMQLFLSHIENNIFIRQNVVSKIQFQIHELLKCSTCDLEISNQANLHYVMNLPFNNVFNLIFFN